MKIISAASSPVKSRLIYGGSDCVCRRREYADMENAEEKNCPYAGMIYKEGELRCDDYDCLACLEGQWVNRKDLEAGSCD